MLIVGAGPAGSASALALCGRGVDGVVLAEASDHRARRIGESLLPLARSVLAELDLLEDFESQGHLACRGSASAWGDAALAWQDYIRTPYGFGWHLDRTRFDAWLADTAAERGAELLRSTRCVSLAPDARGGYAALLQSGSVAEKWTVERVVDATGPRASIARALGARRRVLDRFLCTYGFHALGERATSSRTLLEATGHGWWYAADLPGGEQVAAFACERETLHELALRDPAGWMARVAGTEHVSARVNGCPLLAPLLVRQVLSLHIAPVAGRDWLAVGDAAASFDPLCSHGITKALEDGRDAGVALAASLTGDANAMGVYAEKIAARWADYRVARDSLYASEARWPDATFWRRRRERAHLRAEAQ